MLLLTEMKNREAYKHYSKSKALTPCMFYPLGLLSDGGIWERGYRIREFTTLTLLIFHFHSQPFSVFSHLVLSLSERLTWIVYDCTWFLFPFPLSPLSISTLPHFSIFSSVLFVSLCHPVTHAFLCYSAPSHIFLYLPFHRLFSSCHFLNMALNFFFDTIR